MMRFCVGACFVFACGVLSAETLTWQGGNGGLLSTAANWTANKTPADGDVLSFPNSFAAVTVTNDLTATLGGITLANTGSFVMRGSEPLHLNGLVTSSATIAQNCTSYPSDRIDCPVVLDGNTHFRLTGVPASTSNPNANGCRNLDIYGYISGSGNLVVSNDTQRNVLVRLHCLTNSYTGKTVQWSKGSTYAGIAIYGSATNGPSCLGVNREIDLGGSFRFSAANIVLDRDFVVTRSSDFQVDSSGCVVASNATISGSSLQFRGTSMTIHGFVNNVSMSRNDKGWIYFTNPTNAFSNSNLYILEGAFVARHLAPMGQASSLGSKYTRITLGKNSGSTIGGLAYNGVTDATIDAPIYLDAKTCTGDQGAFLANFTPGTTLTASGTINVNSTTYPYQRLHLQGTGNGVLTGDIAAGVHFVKEDTGTWTIDSETVSTTGTVEVAAGTLVVNTAIEQARSVTVSANATLCGSGTIGVPTVFATGARLKAGSSPLTFTGSVTFPSTVTVDTSDVPQGALRTVVVCTDATSLANLSSVAFVPTDSDVLATVANGSVTVRRKGLFTWTGAVDSLWDTVTANWQTDSESSTTFVNDENATFTDAAPADRCVVSVASGIRAANVTIGGTNDFSFTGEALTILGTLEKSGKGALTLENAVDAGLVHIVEGTLSVQTNADLGRSPVSIEAAGTHTINSLKPLAGALTFGKRYVTNTTVSIVGSALAAENGDPVSLVPSCTDVNKETILMVTSPAVVTNRNLLLQNGGGRVLFRYKQTADTKKDFVWLGDIICANRPRVYIHGPENSFEGRLVIGELGRSVITGQCQILSFRQGSDNREIVVNSRIDVTADSSELNVSSMVRFMAVSNHWSSDFNINSGRAILGTNDTMDVFHGLSFGTADKGSATAWAKSIVDLNGFDQTLTRLYDDNVAYNPWTSTSPNSNSCQMVFSARPATLTISSDSGETRLRFPHTQITGAVTVVKSGRAAMNLYQPNGNTGSWKLLAGTTTLWDSTVQGPQYGGTDLHGTFGASTNVVVGSSGTLVFKTAQPAFASDARLTVDAGGKVQMDADQAVDFLTVDGHEKRSGTYTAAKNPEFVTGSGTLTVRVGDGGLFFIIR